MLNRTVCIVGAASGRGAPDGGCEAAPEALRRSSLSTQLWRAGLDPVWDAILQPTAEPDATEAVRELCGRLSRRVQNIVERNAFPLVLGGDHSCAIGTWSAIVCVLKPPTPSTPGAAGSGIAWAGLNGRRPARSKIEPRST